jgi:magnesium-protoporphyrin IX monomethyl ester (oxidative) cyclase
MDHGYGAEIIDCSHYDSGLEGVIAKLKEDEKPIIGITAYTRERFAAYDLIRKIRNDIPDSLIVVGGRHFTCLADEALKNLPEIDIVVRGEGEITFKEICDSVYNKISINKISGVSFRKEDEIVHNPERPLEHNLDLFRCFDKGHLPDPKKYSFVGDLYKVGGEKRQGKIRGFAVFTSRGCPSRCVFCSLTVAKVRFRSIDNVLNEIEEKIKVTGTRYVIFKDPSLTAVKKHVKELCEKIIERNLNIRWVCYSRVDIELELLKLMKKAGLIGVETALESGSPRVLKAIKKRIDIDKFIRFCIEAYNLEIRVFVFCMVSLPDEKLEDVDMTISLINKLSKYIYTVSGLQATRILPDAALYNIAKERKVLPDNFDWFKPYTSEIDPRISNPDYSTSLSGTPVTI